ncbi:MAG: RNA polymerase sigma-70 factor (ECF subfamily) [Verrucomicrobiales bacterium]|jgi:RNA polymerase sigma-70 factor (ECF subfamily)
MIDDRQLESLYDEYAQRLFGYLLTFTRRDADAPDLLQDIFVKLARNPRCLDKVTSLRAFLFRMAHNLAIDWSRRSRSRRERTDGLAAEADESDFLTATTDPDAEIFREHLETALSTLPDDQRPAVYLKLWGELTAEQIGEVCDIPTNTVSSRYRYGIEKLRRALRPVYDEIND